MPKVLNKYKIGTAHPEAVFIGRPSKWGNPFETTNVTREFAIELYADYLMSNPDLVAQAKIELRGRDLVCFCAPKECHGDFLLLVANEEG